MSASDGLATKEPISASSQRLTQMSGRNEAIASLVPRSAAYENAFVDALLLYPVSVEG